MRKAVTTLSVTQRVLFALLAGALVLATAVPALASAEESEFIALINQSRSAQGLGPLSDFWDLTDDARVHTADMIAAGQIYHSSNAQLSGYTTGWARLGENVGMGPNPSLLHQAFMSSPGHRANILGDFDRVGVGTARSGDGTLFVTVLFMKSSAPATTTTTTTPPPPTTTTTTAPPATSPTTTTTSPPAPTTTTGPAAPVPPTSTTIPQPAEEAKAAPAMITQMSQPGHGDRPATRVSNVRADRSVAEFRPVFSFLDGPSSDWPIEVYTAGGVSVTIE